MVHLLILYLHDWILALVWLLHYILALFLLKLTVLINLFVSNIKYFFFFIKYLICIKYCLTFYTIYTISITINLILKITMKYLFKLLIWWQGVFSPSITSVWDFFYSFMIKIIRKIDGDVLEDKGDNNTSLDTKL